jgi:D-alanyl-D-alanine carboxypeptidase/D-alanyl-D-alanine-endopeptidase (penicillin-binding protein 4)
MKLASIALLIAARIAAGADLAERIAAHMQEAPGIAGVEVVDLATNQVVFSHNAQRLFLPASNMKLFTAAAALSQLGADHRFETRLLREPSGALVLLGGGDPTMSSRVYPYAKDSEPLPSLHAIEALADQAVAAGLRRVDGDIIGDDRRYAWSPYPESWTADDILHDYGAPVSALALNDNAVAIAVHGGSAIGDPVRVVVDPPFEYFTIDNRVKTGEANAVEIAHAPGSRQILLSGIIAQDTRRQIAVDDPALFAAHALYDALLRRGVTVRGRPVARHGVGAPTGELLASRTSPPLSQILQTMLKESQNLHAEMLLREIGGLRALEAFVTELQIPSTEWRSEDGSGLARNDMVTPHAVVRLLQTMDAGSHGELWRALLPVGGQDGTLSDRICCLSQEVTIRAKTGTLSRATALSGYAESRGNGRLAFSILVNNFAEPTAAVRSWVDRLATVLVE